MRLDSQAMRGLPKVSLGGDSVSIAVRDGRIYYGTMSLPCEPITFTTESVLPAFATQRDLALAKHRHSRAELVAAGHAAELKRVERRIGKSVERAASALAWLGISEYEVERCVEAHLRSVATGSPGHLPPRPAPPLPRLVVVDDQDQLQLLSDTE